MTRRPDGAVCFTIGVVDEVELAEACIGHVRRAYPTSAIVLLVDSADPAVVERWREVAERLAVEARAVPTPVYAMENGGLVVAVHLEAFLAIEALWWFKIDPDTFVRRPLDELPDAPCFFGTVQGGHPRPSLQGGCIGGTRDAVRRLHESGVLASPALLDPESTWATGNQILLRRLADRRLVSFDFVHAWAAEQIGVPLVDHPEIKSLWLGPPRDGSRYAVTHPHKSLGRETPTDLDEPTELARRVREIVRLSSPAGAIVAVVSKGDDELVAFDGREGCHFPSEQGFYAGYHPADGAEALGRLEYARRRGAEFLVVPQPSFWWLDYYGDFRAYLEERYRLVTWQPDTCVVFDLRDDGERAANINTARYWDRVYRAEAQRGDMEQAGYIRDYGPIHDAIVSLVPDDARVLDLGCGPGVLCRKIKRARPGAAVTGVDFSRFVVERNERVDADMGITYLCRDLRSELGSLDGGYDVVSLCEVLEHLEEPERVAEEAVGLVGPGGRLVLTCPHDEAGLHPEHLRRWGHDEVFHLLAPYSTEVVFRSFRPPYDRWLLATFEKAPATDAAAEAAS